MLSTSSTAPIIFPSRFISNNSFIGPLNIISQSTYNLSLLLVYSAFIHQYVCCLSLFLGMHYGRMLSTLNYFVDTVELASASLNPPPKALNQFNAWYKGKIFGIVGVKRNLVDYCCSRNNGIRYLKIMA